MCKLGPKHRMTLIAAASLAFFLVASVSTKGCFAAYEEAIDLYNAVLKLREELLLQTTLRPSRLEPTWLRFCGYVSLLEKPRRSSVRH